MDWGFKTSVITMPTFVDNALVGKEREKKKRENICIVLKTYLYSLLFCNCPDRCQRKFLPIKIYESMGGYFYFSKKKNPNKPEKN